MEILYLHALPLDGSMWARQMDLAPGSAIAPELYTLGNSIEEWAAGALQLTTSDQLIVIGCSVGGSCALEVAMAASERVAALVLIGTKAAHRPNPDFCASAIELLERHGTDAAWDAYWAPLFSKRTDPAVVEAARQIALQQLPSDLAKGIEVFHSRPSRDQFIGNWPKPVAVVTGADDVAPGVAVSKATAASALNGHLHIVPSCGHYIPLEQPTGAAKRPHRKPVQSGNAV